MPKGLAGRGEEWFSSAKPDRLVGTEAAARVSCGEPITPFRTANSPTETIRVWPHRIRQRLPSPVRFPAREARSAGVFRSLRQEDGARETGWLRGQSRANPSLAGNSLLTGKITGNFAKSEPIGASVAGKRVAATTA